MYKSYDNDPYGVRIYTLDNGLKVYLCQDLDEPRITSFSLAYSFITFMALLTLRINANVTPQAVLL